MEYVAGESLKQIIERKSGTSAALRKQKKAGSEPRLRAHPLAGTEGLSRSWWVPALRIGIHISRALDYAYENSLIHRNVTPQNILIRSHDKFTKLGDLILAKALEGPLAANLTCPRTLLGELHYMAPERTRGSKDLDCRSDIYGLGAALYALLTGQPPYEGGSLDETMERIRRGSLTTFKEHGLAVPESMERTVLKMLAGDPEDRYQTPAELLARLERIAAEEQVTC